MIMVMGCGNSALDASGAEDIRGPCAGRAFNSATTVMEGELVKWALVRNEPHLSRATRVMGANG